MTTESPLYHPLTNHRACRDTDISSGGGGDKQHGPGLGVAGGGGEAGAGHRVLGDHRGQHAGALPADPGLPRHPGLCHPPGVHSVIAVVSRYTLCTWVNILTGNPYLHSIGILQILLL